jgi:hypothetical protein
LAVNRFDLPAVYAALVAKIQEIITTVKNAGISPDLAYMAWDSRGDVNELPNHDLLGIVDWTWAENEDHLPDIEFGMLLSVKHDSNLFREVEILNEIRKACVKDTGNKPEYLVWTVRDADNVPFAQLQVTDFSIMPSGESEARTVRSIGISLKRADYAR